MRSFPFFFLKSSKVADTTVRNGTIYEFSNFRLIPDDDLLLRNGEPIPLAPKVFATLALLLEHHGHLVKKSELIEKVWSNAFVEEAAVSRCVWTIRNALGEDSNGQQFIQTVPKRGYKFVAPVSIVDEKVPDAVHGDNLATKPLIETLRRQGYRFNGQLKTNGTSADAETASIAPELGQVAAATRSYSLRWLFVLAGISVVVAVAIGYFYLRSPITGTSSSRKHFAVLPLRPIEASSRNDLYEYGIADALINRLNSISGFVARPLNATRGYTDIGQDAVSIGREQQVDYVLISNYQLAEGRIRITAQLVNVATGQTEQQYKFEDRASSVFAIQDAIGVDFGNKAMAWFSSAPLRTVANRGTSSEEAYRLYLHGMYLYDRRRLQEAVNALKQAVELDPNYARAWAGLAHANGTYMQGRGRRMNLSDQEMRLQLERERRERLGAINRALSLDPNLSEAYSALCAEKFVYEWDFAGAEAACKRAVELDANSSLAHQNTSRFLMSRGRLDEAMVEAKTAIDLEPTSVFNHRALGNCLMFAKRYDEAEAQNKRVIEMDKMHNANGYQWLAMTYELQGKHGEAFETFLELLRQRQDSDEETIRAFQAAYANDGWKGFLRERVARFEDIKQNYFQAAAYCVLLGDNDRAIVYLEKSVEQREWNVGHMLLIDPRLDAIRDDPRFIRIVQRVEGH